MEKDILNKILDQTIELHKKMAKFDSTLNYFGIQLNDKTSQFRRLEQRMDSLENFKLTVETKESVRPESFWAQSVKISKGVTIVGGLVYIFYDILKTIGL